MKQLLRSRRGMTLVELMVTMLLLLVFMGVVTTVVSALGNVVAENTSFNRSISIADTVLDQIEADTRMATAIKCRGGAAGPDGDSRLAGPELEYVSEKQGFTIRLSAPTKTDLPDENESARTLYTGKKPDSAAELTKSERTPGYLERRYYAIPAAGGGTYACLTTDGLPYAKGLNQPFVADFYLGSTVAVDFKLESPTVNEETGTLCYRLLLATVKVMDDKGVPVYQAKRSILLQNVPALADAVTAETDG